MKRRCSYLMVLAVLAGALAYEPAARAGDDSLANGFDKFCASWMQKLAQREADNVQHVKWEPNDAGVEGKYIGYSREHKCDLKPPAQKQGVPIGKISYREMLYRKHGVTSSAAASSNPEVVEITEVTEIFRCEKGKWVY